MASEFNCFCANALSSLILNPCNGQNSKWRSALATAVVRIRYFRSSPHPYYTLLHLDDRQKDRCRQIRYQRVIVRRKKLRMMCETMRALARLVQGDKQSSSLYSLGIVNSRIIFWQSFEEYSRILISRSLWELEF